MCLGREFWGHFLDVPTSSCGAWPIPKYELRMTGGTGTNLSDFVLALGSPVRVDACGTRAVGVAFLWGASSLSLSDGICV